MKFKFLAYFEFVMTKLFDEINVFFFCLCSAESLGKVVVHMIREGDNGSVWLSEHNLNPPNFVTPNRYEVLSTQSNCEPILPTIESRLNPNSYSRPKSNLQTHRPNKKISGLPKEPPTSRTESISIFGDSHARGIANSAKEVINIGTIGFVKPNATYKGVVEDINSARSTGNCSSSDFRVTMAGSNDIYGNNTK